MALRLGLIADDKPVKVALEMPADLFRALAAYAEVHAVVTGQPAVPPTRLIVPMLAEFMASDREFAKLRRGLPGKPMPSG